MQSWGKPVCMNLGGIKKKKKKNLENDTFYF